MSGSLRSGAGPSTQWMLDALADATGRARPGRARRWYRLKNEAPGKASLWIDGEIGWDVLSSTFCADLQACDVAELDVHINSGGGDVGDGLTIYNALRAHQAHVNTVVMGYAFSAASLILQAGDRRLVSEASMTMIHRSQTLIYGNADALATGLTLVKEFDDQLAGVYSRRSGKGTAASWLEAMKGDDDRDGSWYNAEAAVAAGLADEVVEGTGTSYRESETASAANIAFLDTMVAAHQSAPAVPGAAAFLADVLEDGRRSQAEAKAEFGAFLRQHGLAT